MKAEAFLNSKVGGYVALGVLGIAVLWYVKRQAGAVLNSVNPLNNDNVINKGAVATTDAVFGKDSLSNFTDHALGAIDLLNPFNESDAYALGVWGLSDSKKSFDNFFTMPEFTIDYLNPASDKNLAYQGATKVVGQDNLATAGDYFFGLIDLINPFNTSDDYAKKVYKMDEDHRIISNNNQEGIY